jgi:preprotein translocase subunit Sec63
VAVQAVCLVIFGADAFLRGMPGSPRDTLALVAPFPLAGLLRLFADGNASATLFVAGLVVLGIILAIVARPWWREMRETQRLVGSGTRP